MSKYLKTNSPAVISAYREMMASAIAMREKARKLCSQFDATPVISQCVSRYTFHGMRLNNYDAREDKHLWTKPDHNKGFVSRPRGRLTGFSPELKELKARIERAQGDMLTSVTKDQLYEALGTNWGTLLLYGGIAAFEGGDHIYICSAVNLDGCEEITASEYQAAEQASREAQ